MHYFCKNINYVAYYVLTSVIVQYRTTKGITSRYFAVIILNKTFIPHESNFIV